MKTVFTLLISIFALGAIATAKGDRPINNEYIICTFNDNVTSTEISELQKTGVSIIKVSEANQKVVYIEKCQQIALSPLLESKISSITLVNTNGQQIPLAPKATSKSSPPCFVNMFFNFLY